MARRSGGGGRSYIFYTPNGGNTLLNAIAARNNPRNSYFFQVSAPEKDKTTLRALKEFQRYEQAGANIHPMAEFNMTAWRKKPGSWFDKGVQFRQEMTQLGIPNATWDINESGSGVRNANPVARRQLANLVRGLSTGGGQFEKDKGMIFQQGPGYRDGLKSFLGDDRFWKTMKQNVRQYIPEVYSTPKRFYSLKPQARHKYLTGILAQGRMQTPMLSALWNKSGGGAWGNPNTTGIPIPKMERFINAQSRPFAKSRAISYVWNEHPNNPNADPMVDSQLARLAAHIARMANR